MSKRDYYEVLGIRRALQKMKSKKHIASFLNNIIQILIKRKMLLTNLKK